MEISGAGAGELDWSSEEDAKQGHIRVQPNILPTGWLQEQVG